MAVQLLFYRMLLSRFVQNNSLDSFVFLGAVEYTDCTSAKGQAPIQRVSWYDTKQSFSEAPAILELWGMWNTPSLPSLPGLLWLRVVAPDRVLWRGQIELKCVLMLNWIVWNRTVLSSKLRTYGKLNCLKRNYFWHWQCTYTKLNCMK